MKYIINYTTYFVLYILINLVYLIWEFKVYNGNFKKFVDKINEPVKDYDYYDDIYLF